MNVNEFVKVAEKLTGVSTVYMYGCYGQPVTQKLIDYKTKQYPEWYTEERREMLKRHIGKSFGFDCSGTIKSILWGFNFDIKLENGGAIYGSNGVKDTNADTMYNLCTRKSTDFSYVPVGALLHTKGHVGIYIGNGKCVECTPKKLNGVQYSTVMNITGNSYNNDFLRKWEHWGLLPYVDYNSKDEVEDLKLLLNSIYNILTDAKKKNIF